MLIIERIIQRKYFLTKTNAKFKYTNEEIDSDERLSRKDKHL